ncbi:LOW QUALITY PROTEIN: uncharacterized protein LOC143227344 [Tachypleus tridentatus]|uniref:LOW QUALITY PROTEIN: uncharacterized protein LOC143227344 n=1 Tax=Tachypleus tridentatus TaxID=6853 RepID=UPI003FD3865E
MPVIFWLINTSILLGIFFSPPASTTSRPCKEDTEFSCRTDSSICISLTQLHDGKPDCPDKSDEECLPGEFQCQTSRQCIPEDRVRDGWEDCRDGSDEDCGSNQHRCGCGFPRCLEQKYVGDGISDCLDGSDENEETSSYLCPDEDQLQGLLGVERKKREADITGLVQPTGLLSSLVNSEVRGRTTILYVTQIFGTYVGNNYAKIYRTKHSAITATETLSFRTREPFSRISIAASPERDRFLTTARHTISPTKVFYPTGLISTITGTEITDDRTTIYTTEVHRKYIDGTYAQVLKSYSTVMYPAPSVNKIEAGASGFSTYKITSASERFASLTSGKVYQTAVNELASSLSSSTYHKHEVEKLENEIHRGQRYHPLGELGTVPSGFFLMGDRLIQDDELQKKTEKYLSSLTEPLLINEFREIKTSPTAGFIHTVLNGLTGSFVQPEDNVQETTLLEVGLRDGRIGTVFHDHGEGSVMTVTGTQRIFVHQSQDLNTSYKLFTGTYVRGAGPQQGTYMFFFGQRQLPENTELIQSTRVEEQILFGETKIGSEDMEDTMYHEVKLTQQKAIQASQEDKQFNTPKVILSQFEKKKSESYAPYEMYEATVLNKGDILNLGNTRNIKPKNIVYATVYPESYYRRAQYEDSQQEAHRLNIKARQSARKVGALKGDVTITDETQSPPTADNTFGGLEYTETDPLKIGLGNGNQPKQNLRRAEKSILEPHKITQKSDFRLTKTVGRFGPIYDPLFGTNTFEVPEDKFLYATFISSTSEKPREGRNFETKMTKPLSSEIITTVTLFGFAKFSTVISGTQVLFLPSSVPYSQTEDLYSSMSDISVNKKMKTKTEIESTEINVESQIIKQSMKTSKTEKEIESKSEGFLKDATDLVFVTETFPTLESMFFITKSNEAPKNVMITEKNVDQFSSELKFSSKVNEIRSEYIFSDLIGKDTNTETASEEYQIMSSKGYSSSVVAKDLVSPTQPLKHDTSTTSIETTLYPTGLITSLTGKEINDGVTTEWKTLVYGTFINGKYAHVIQSTSSLFFTVQKTKEPVTETDDYELKTINSFELGVFEETSSSKSYSENQADSDYSSISLLSQLSRDEMPTSVYSSGISSTKSYIPETEDYLSSDNISSKGPFVDESEIHVIAEPEESDLYVSNELNSLSVLKQRSSDILLKSISLKPSIKIMSSIENKKIISDISNSLQQQSNIFSSVMEKLTESQDFEVMSSTATEVSSIYPPDHLISQTPEISEEVTDEVVTISLPSKEQNIFLLTSADTAEETQNSQQASASVILTAGFILPGLVVETKETNTLLQSTTVGEVPSLSNSFTSSLPSILTGNFIIPGKSEPSEETTGEAKTIVGGFILPDTQETNQESSTEINSEENVKETHHILTAGFILPGRDGEKRPLSEEKKRALRRVMMVRFKDDVTSNSETSAKTILTGGFILPNINVEDNTKPTDLRIETTSSGLSSSALDSLVTQTEKIIEAGEDNLSNAKDTRTQTAKTSSQTTLTGGFILPNTQSEDITKHARTDIEDTRRVLILPTPSVNKSKKSEKDERDFVFSDLSESAKTSRKAKEFLNESSIIKDDHKSNSLTQRQISRERQLGANKSTVTFLSHEVEGLLPSISFPVTYFTTLTYFTTYLKDGNTKVSSSEEIRSQIFTDSEQLERSQKATSSAVDKTLASEITSTKTLPPITYYTTYTYFTTVYRGGSSTISTSLKTVTDIVSSSVTSPISETVSPTYSVLVYPTTYYTTLTYYTTIVRNGKTSVNSQEEVRSNVVTPRTQLKSTKELVEVTSPLPSLNRAQKKTYFTTYTYYTTHYKNGTPIVNSRFDTVSTVVSDQTKDHSEISNEKQSIVFESDTSVLRSSLQILKTTFYTTFTYFTTVLKGDKTIVKTNEHTITNVVASGVTETISKSKSSVIPTPVVQTLYTTYTYFTTLLIGGSTTVTSSESVVTNTKTVFASAAITIPKKQTSIITSTGDSTLPARLEDENTIKSSFLSSFDDGITVISTLSESLNDKEESTTLDKTKSRISLSANDVRVLKTAITSYSNGNPGASGREKTLTSSVSKKIIHSDLILPGSVENKSTIKPSTAIETFFTTYTYLTTYYKDNRESVSTRKETVTKYVTVTDGIQPTSTRKVNLVVTSTNTPSTVTPALQGSFSSELDLNELLGGLGAPSTQYTTYTYFTTLFRDGSTVVSSDTKVVSSVITGSLDLDAIARSAASQLKRNRLTQAAQLNKENNVSPTTRTKFTTHYTTFTYFSTIIKDGSTSVSSHLTTVTNVATETSILPVSKLPSVPSTEEDKIRKKRDVTTTTSSFYTTRSTKYKDDYLEEKTYLKNVPIYKSKYWRYFDNVNKYISSFGDSMSSAPETRFLTYTQNETPFSEGYPFVVSRGAAVPNVVLDSTLPTSTGFQRLKRPPTKSFNDDKKSQFKIFLGNSKNSTNTPVRRKLLTFQEYYHVDNYSDVLLSKKKESHKKSKVRSMIDQNNLYPTGLLHSLKFKDINKGITTIYSTEVYGTFIRGSYTQLTERHSYTYPKIADGSDKTNIPLINPTPVGNTLLEPQTYKNPSRVGLLSSFVNSEINDETTTFYTTKIHGSYIGHIYVHVDHTTSSIKMPESSTSAPIGLLSSIASANVIGPSTTFWTTKIYGINLNTEPKVSKVLNFSNQKISIRSTPKLDAYKKDFMKTHISTTVNNNVSKLFTTNFMNEIYGQSAQISSQTTYSIKSTTVTASSFASVFKSTNSYKAGLISSAIRSRVNEDKKSYITAKVFHGSDIGFYDAEVPRSSNINKVTTEPDEYNMGLLSSSDVNNDLLTLNVSNRHGTYISGVNSHVKSFTAQLLSVKPISTKSSRSTQTDLVSATTSTEVNYGITTLHTTLVYGTSIEGLYTHIVRQAPRVLPVSKSTMYAKAEDYFNTDGFITSTLRTELNDWTTTLHTTLSYGTNLKGFYTDVTHSSSTVIAPTSVKINSQNMGLVEITGESNDGTSTLHTTQTYFDVAKHSSNILTDIDNLLKEKRSVLYPVDIQETQVRYQTATRITITKQTNNELDRPSKHMEASLPSDIFHLKENIFLEFKNNEENEVEEAVRFSDTKRKQVFEFHPVLNEKVKLFPSPGVKPDKLLHTSENPVISTLTPQEFQRNENKYGYYYKYSVQNSESNFDDKENTPKNNVHFPTPGELTKKNKAKVDDNDEREKIIHDDGLKYSENGDFYYDSYYYYYDDDKQNHHDQPHKRTTEGHNVFASRRSRRDKSRNSFSIRKFRPFIRPKQTLGQTSANTLSNDDVQEETSNVADDETTSFNPTEKQTSGISIKPFLSRARPALFTHIKSPSKPSFTFRIRRPSFTRRFNPFGKGSDENVESDKNEEADSDNEEEKERDNIEASEAVISTTTSQKFSFDTFRNGKRRPFLSRNTERVFQSRGDLHLQRFRKNKENTESPREEENHENKQNQFRRITFGRRFGEDDENEESPKNEKTREILHKQFSRTTYVQRRRKEKENSEPSVKDETVEEQQTQFRRATFRRRIGRNNGQRQNRFRRNTFGSRPRNHNKDTELPEEEKTEDGQQNQFRRTSFRQRVRKNNENLELSKKEKAKEQRQNHFRRTSFRQIRRKNHENTESHEKGETQREQKNHFRRTTFARRPIKDNDNTESHEKGETEDEKQNYFRRTTFSRKRIKDNDNTESHEKGETQRKQKNHLRRTTFARRPIKDNDNTESHEKDSKEAENHLRRTTFARRPIKDNDNTESHEKGETEDEKQNYFRRTTFSRKRIKDNDNTESHEKGETQRKQKNHLRRTTFARRPIKDNDNTESQEKGETEDEQQNNFRRTTFAQRPIKDNDNTESQEKDETEKEQQNNFRRTTFARRPIKDNDNTESHEKKETPLKQQNQFRRTSFRRRSGIVRKFDRTSPVKEEVENDEEEDVLHNRITRVRLRRPKINTRRQHRPHLQTSFNLVNRADHVNERKLSHSRFHLRSQRKSSSRESKSTQKSSSTAVQTSSLNPVGNVKTPVTLSSFVSATKTLPIYHGFRTSYATITTTMLESTIIEPSEYSIVTSDGTVKTLYSSKVGVPDLNGPSENSYTTITEIIITTSSLETFETVQRIIGYSTRTDTLTSHQVYTKLTTIYSTITPHAQTLSVLQQPFQLPFFPSSIQNSVSYITSSNSYVTTETIYSTRVLPIFLRGRTHYRTLTSTILSESTVVKTSTIEVPQAQQPLAFIPHAYQAYFPFKQLTTQLTFYVPGTNGDLKPVVTNIAIPIFQQPILHTKIARSLHDNYLKPEPSESRIHREPEMEEMYMNLLSSEGEVLNENQLPNSIIQTESLENAKLRFQKTENPNDVTMIFRDQIKEIYEESVTLAKSFSEKSNYISKTEDRQKYDFTEALETRNERYAQDKYGLNSSFKKRKLQQHKNIENDDDYTEYEDYQILTSSENEEESHELPNRADDIDAVDATNLVGLKTKDESEELEDVASDVPVSGNVSGDKTILKKRRTVIRRIKPSTGGLNLHRRRSVVVKRTRLNQIPPLPTSSSSENKNLPNTLLTFDPTLSRNKLKKGISETSTFKPVRRIIRLKRPLDQTEENRRVFVTKKLKTDELPNNVTSLQVREPSTSDDEFRADERINTLNTQTFQNIIYSSDLPLTFYTTFTYFTTFVKGTISFYTSREAVRSSIALKTPNPEIINIIQKYSGYTSVLGEQTFTPLGSRLRGGTTTIVNLRSKVQVVNSNIQSELFSTKTVQSSETKTLFGKDNDYVPDTDLQSIKSNNVKKNTEVTEPYYPVFDRAQLQASYISAGDASLADQYPSALEATPEIPANKQEGSTVFDEDPPLQVVKSIVRRPFGNLRSRTFQRRPGVRVRVKSVTSDVKTIPDLTDGGHSETLPNRDLELSDNLSSSNNLFVSSLESTESDLELNQNVVSGIDLDYSAIISTPVVTSTVDTSRNINKETSTSATDETDSTSASRKRLKITVRRPIGAIRPSRTNARFVLPSRLSVTSRSQYYIVTRSNPLSALRPSRRPYGVKVSKRLRASTKAPVLTTEIGSYSNTTTSRISLQEKVVTTSHEVAVTVSSALSTTVEQTTSRIVTQPTAEEPTGYSTDSKHHTTISSSFHENSSDRENPVLELDSSSGENYKSILSSFLSSSGTDDAVPTFTPEELIELEKSMNGVLKDSSSVPRKHVVDQMLTTKFHPIPSTPDVLAEEESSLSDITIVPSIVQQDVNDLQTFYTTFTLYTTLFSGSSPIVSSSEKVVSNVVTFPSSGRNTSFSTPTVPGSHLAEVFSTLIETSEKLKTTTVFSTSTLFATLFNGSSSFVSSIEDVHSEVYTVTELVTFTRTLDLTVASTETLPTSVESSKPLKPTPVYSTVTDYTTLTNFITLFQEDSSFISSIEEVVSNVYTITLHGSIAKSSPSIPETINGSKPSTIVNTSFPSSTTSFVLLSNSYLPSPVESFTPFVETRLSLPESRVASKRLKVPSVRLFTPKTRSTSESPKVPFIKTHLFKPKSRSTSETSKNLEPSLFNTFSILSTDIRPTVIRSTSEGKDEPVFEITKTITQTLYSTNTHYITLFSGTQTILSSIEEVYSNLITTTAIETIKGSITINPIDISTTEEIYSSKMSAIVTSKTASENPTETYHPQLVPSLQTYFTTYTYYTTLNSGTNTIVSSKEEVATSYVTVFVPEKTSIKSEALTTNSVITSSVSYTGKTDYSTYTFFTTLFDGEDQVIVTNQQIIPHVKKSSLTVTSELFPTPTRVSSESVLTFFSTFTYYSTFTTGGQTRVSTSLKSVKQFVTVQPTTATEITGSKSLLVETLSLRSSHTVSAIDQSLETAVILHKPSTSVTSTSDKENVTSVIGVKRPSTSILTKSDTEEYVTAVRLNKPTSSVPFSNGKESMSVITLLPKAVSTKTSRLALFDVSTMKEGESKQMQTEGIKTSLSMKSTTSPHIEPSVFSEKIMTKIHTEGSGKVDSEEKPTTTYSEHTETMPLSSLKPFKTEEQEKDITSTELAGKNTTEKIVVIETIRDTTSSSSKSLVSGTSTTIVDGSTIVFFTDFIFPDKSQSSLSTYAASTKTAILKETKNVSFSSEAPIIIPSYTRGEKSGLSKTYEKTDNTSQDIMNATSGFVTKLSEFVLPSAISHDKQQSNETSADEEDSIQSGSVIDLSDLLEGNPNIAGNLAEAVKGILNKINITGSTINETRGFFPGLNPEEKNKDVSTKPSSVQEETEQTTQSLNTSYEEGREPKNVNVPISGILSHSKKPYGDKETQTFTGIKTIFFKPTPVSEVTATSQTVLLVPPGLESRNESTMKLEGSIKTISEIISSGTVTPEINTEGTESVLAGFKTLFVDTLTRQVQKSSDKKTTSQLRTRNGSSIKLADKKNEERTVTEEAQKFGTSFTQLLPNSQSIGSRGHTTKTKPPPEVKTIFFPLPSNKNQIPGTSKKEEILSNDNTPTRYVTSLESGTRTLTLTTTKTVFTRKSTITISSTFTTTIAPRTFVSTIIGNKTILGTLSKPTGSVKLEETELPSESTTTTVTTTTMVFNSITTTVVRTLVLQNEEIKPTKVSNIIPSTTTGNIFKVNFPTRSTPTDTTTPKIRTLFKGTFLATPKRKTESTKTTTRKPFLLFRPKSRPTVPTTPAPKFIGPIPKLRFPTRPPTPPPTSPPPPKSTSSSGEDSDDETKEERCIPECNAKNKETCKKTPVGLSCECGPGFARNESSTLCEDIKSYVVVLRLVRMKESVLTYKTEFSNSLSPEFKELAVLAKKGIHQAYENSKVKQNYVTADVNSISSVDKMDDVNEVDEGGVLVNFTVRVKRNSVVDEKLLSDQLSQSIEASNYSVGNTELFASSLTRSVQNVQDFNECTKDYNDCAKTAICINVPGTYTCKCKDFYEDLDPKLPGRVCSGEIKNCDFCNYRGDCIMTDGGSRICRCHRLYLGTRCHINGLILAIALPITAALLILISCSLFYCYRRWLRQRQQKVKSNAMIRAMGVNNGTQNEGTTDKKAMILNSSFNGSIDHGIRHPYAFDNPYQPEDGTLPRKTNKESEPSLGRNWSTGVSVQPVIIPRVKHHHQLSSKQAGNKDIGDDGQTGLDTSEAANLQKGLLALLEEPTHTRSLLNMKESSSFATLPTRLKLSSPEETEASSTKRKMLRHSSHFYSKPRALEVASSGSKTSHVNSVPTSEVSHRLPETAGLNVNRLARDFDKNSQSNSEDRRGLRKVESWQGLPRVASKRRDSETYMNIEKRRSNTVYQPSQTYENIKLMKEGVVHSSREYGNIHTGSLPANVKGLRLSSQMETDSQYSKHSYFGPLYSNIVEMKTQRGEFEDNESSLGMATKPMFLPKVRVSKRKVVPERKEDVPIQHYDLPTTRWQEKSRFNNTEKTPVDDLVQV